MLIAGTIAARDRQFENLQRHRILKPTTTILIILMALLAFPSAYSAYWAYLLAGLVFCLLGDVFLMYEKYFVYGLAAFLVGHILFIIAFTQFEDFDIVHWIAIPLLVFGIGYYYYLYPSLKKLTIPVAFYFLAILLMDFTAVSLFIQKGTFPFAMIMAGALLFTLSDSMIAIRKFKKPFKNSELWILGTYWIAIYLLALSTHFLK
jgi:uncharacterized membrane protein YhhN